MCHTVQQEVIVWHAYSVRAGRRHGAIPRVRFVAPWALECDRVAVVGIPYIGSAHIPWGLTGKATARDRPTRHSEERASQSPDW